MADPTGGYNFSREGLEAIVKFAFHRAFEMVMHADERGLVMDETYIHREGAKLVTEITNAMIEAEHKKVETPEIVDQAGNLVRLVAKPRLFVPDITTNNGKKIE